MDLILTLTSVVVRGTVGSSYSYLSKDETEVLTDYPLINPVVLYQSTGACAPQAGLPSFTVTLLGGTVTINGLSNTSVHEALAPLRPGTEYLFLLMVDDQNNCRVTGKYYGVFDLSNGGLQPTFARKNYASEYRQLSSAQGIEAILSKLRTTRP
jgi:hypothetical protein